MTPLIDTSSFQLGVAPDEDPEVEQPLQDELEARAVAFIRSQRWAPPIAETLLAFAVGGILGLFLVRFAGPIASGEGDGDTEVWVVVGDLPSIYLDTLYATTRWEALAGYCGIAEDWADAVLAGADLSDCYPIPVEPTRELAEMLKSRVAFIREELMPLVE